MKFARYLEDTQIPEWKKKYIDFKGLKKQISAIRRARDVNASGHFSIGSSGGTPRQVQNSPQTHRSPKDQLSSSPNQRTYGSTDVSPSVGVGSSSMRGPPPLELPPPVTNPTYGPNSIGIARRSTVVLQEPPARLGRSQTSIGALEGVNHQHHQHRPRLFPSFPTLRRRPSSWRQSTWRFTRSDIQLYTTIAEFLNSAGLLERQFFVKLDQEAEKIEDFYTSREGMARSRLSMLREQLRELRGHRKLYHANNQRAIQPGGWISAVSDMLPTLSHNQEASRFSQATVTPGSPVMLQTQTRKDPDDYTLAKKELKIATLEFYRGLELLNDYRVLNETGFRKALKKFDKYTKNVCRDLYMNEKIEPLRFAHKETIAGMMKEVEQLYAESFEKGDTKKSRNRLRATARVTTHHSSAFRAGIFFGLALPAIVIGLREALRDDVHTRVPEWNPLLQVYAALFIPTAFSALITLNLLAWAHARVNYVFIFELDLRSAMDSRQYAQIPAFLLFLLSYAFMFSFTDVWTPTAWPLLWIAVTAAFMLDPLPLFMGKARLWLVRLTGGLLISGLRPVQFADFWLGDQFCSLAYTLGNLYYIGCAATLPGGWQHASPRCDARDNPHWEIMFVLSSLPSIVRMVQCVRRFVDEGKGMHLVNAGKYGSSILTYLCYYIWRYHGGETGSYMIIWMIFATISSCYTTYWDLVMDWSVFTKSWPPQWLQREVVYRDYTWLYPVATVINVLLRFAWTIYVPTRGPTAQLRGFIAGCLEALRRIQWNLLRLENEHVGNADQFRATREVPLPYRFQDVEDDSDDEGSPARQGTLSRMRRRAHDSTVRVSGLHAVEDGDETAEPDAPRGP